MKGKVLSLKIILTMLLILTAGFCFAVNSVSSNTIQEKKLVSTAVFLGEAGKEQEFSALFSGDVIFSVEKVKVGATSELPGTNPNDITFVGPYDEGAGKYKKYVFQDLPSDDKDKTVIDNGEFVKLENIYNGNNYHINGSSTLQEAIMISFGAYVYDKSNEKIEIAKEDDEATANVNEAVYAGITKLDVVITKDGKEIEGLTVRNEGLYFDFVYLIKQGDNNEGRYNITLHYMAKNQEHTAEFEFSLVNNTSYTRTLNSNFGYNAKPTLGWQFNGDFEKTADVKDYNRYYYGDTGLNVNQTAFPTLTYDYTKYRVTYSHTANQKVSNHTITPYLSGNAYLNWVEQSSFGTKSRNYDLLDYNAENNVNLVSIMFTQPGTYVFTYEYLHEGKVINDYGFEKGEIRLAIYGLNAYYSKTGFESAKLEYYQIAYKKGNNIDLIVRDGFEFGENVSQQANQKLGFVYSLVESENREGNVLKENTINSLINTDLKNSKVLDAGNYNATTQNDFDYLLKYINDSTKKTELSAIINSIDYVQTNQGSMSINGNDIYKSNNSFYFYSQTEIDAKNFFIDQVDKDGNVVIDDEGNPIKVTPATPFTNATSFNKKGYYLVFVQVDPSGLTDDSDTYYQIFAFQYTSSAVDIKINAIDGENKEVIANGKFTNKQVEILYKVPGIFDRSISGYYYGVANQVLEREQLLQTYKSSLRAEIETRDGEDYYVAQLGSLGQVPNETFMKYLISIESEGDSATYKTFTIDRQSISGIQPYLVQQMTSGNVSYYTFATNVNNFNIPINSSITNGLATLVWDDKNSGAEITAKFSYTPFSLTSINDVEMMTGNNSKEWLLTNYELGTTISGSPLTRSNSRYIVDSESILYNQGIYIITLTDSAGNVCHYSLVIDRTENYFRVGENYLSKTSRIYGADIEYNVGDYKAIKLNTSNAEFKKLIELAATNSLASFENYYLGSYSNYNVLPQIIQKVGNDYYLTVKNERVFAYNTENELDTGISAKKGTLVYNVNNGESYYKRALYVVSQNHTYLRELSSSHTEFDTFVQKNSYVVVEINKDNARGMVYYSDNPIDETTIDGGNAKVKSIRLDTGSDVLDVQGNEIANGLNKAHATSSKYVAFVWNKGTGGFEVAEVYYTFYSLKESTYNNNKYYFYNNGEKIELYKNGKWSNNAKGISNDRGIVNFNGTNASKDGLYVVTRIYKDSIDLGDDDKEKNYYFIVDRNNIIEGRIGENIKIQLLENEEDYNNFKVQNVDYDTFSYLNDNILNRKYNIYLTTSKLPATLKIPTGKYVDGNKVSSGYYAGKLNVSVYFNDVYGQLTNQFKYSTTKIYDSKNLTGVNGYFEVDIYKYLSNYNSTLRDRIARSVNGQGAWLFLSGDYIVRITDNTKDVNGDGHETVFAFKINSRADNGPVVDSLTGFNKTDMIKINFENQKATVSQEYLKVVLPKYLENVVNRPQVDPNYLIVKQYYDGNVSYYINHPYSPVNGIPISGAGGYEDYVTKNADGSINIWLDTKLRNADGTINVDGFNIPLEYEFTIRYKIGNGTSNELYKDCYFYYDEQGKKVYFYEKTFKIQIDRVAPDSNIEYLNANDTLVEEYNAEFGVEEMISTGYHETSSNLYFTKQYSKYYQTDRTNKGYIYVYQVDDNTPFTQGENKIYYKYLDSLANLKSYNLKLPFTDVSSYTFVDEYGITTYGFLPITNAYYEVIEMDKAGNVTQYVVHYCPNITTAEIRIPTTVTTTIGDIESFDIELDYSDLTNVDKNIYVITADGETVSDCENYFIVEVKLAGSTIYKALTTVSTNFEKLTEDVVNAITSEGSGSFFVTITTRSNQATTQINLFDQSNKKIIDINNLIVVNNGTYQIKLDGANIYDDVNKLWFFATNIKVKTSSSTQEYVAKVDEIKGVEYYNGGNVVNNTIDCLLDTTYHLTMTDVFGNVSKIRFNTAGKEFVILNFEDFNNNGVSDDYYRNDNDGVYYGFTDATIYYDKTIYTADCWVKNTSGSYDNYKQSLNIFFNNIDATYDAFKITAKYDELTGKDGIIEVKVDLTDSSTGILESTYFITIDTRLTDISLRDAQKGDKKDIIKVFPNTSYDDETARADKTTSGYMNLIWDKVADNDYFNYKYTLYELLDNNTYRIGPDGNVGLDLSNVTNHIIATQAGSKGIYKFVISVYGKNDVYLGNRVYAFEVHSQTSQIYYVRDVDGNTVLANSTFTMEELGGAVVNPNDIPADVDQSLNLPLYITNQTLEVVISMDNVEKEEREIKLQDSNLSMRIYKIYKSNAYAIYLGVLNVPQTANLINGLNIGGVEVKTSTAIEIAGEKTKEITFNISLKPIALDFAKKNLILVDIYYMQKLVETKVYNSAFALQGNGEYSFVIKDLAGNVHEFVEDEDGNNDETVDYVNAYILREVIVTINGEAPVDNGFYNSDVQLVIYQSMKYITGSVSLYAEKNGSPYTPIGYNPYVFKDYGTYRVTVSAKYRGVEKPLTKVVTFTIINEKEARQAIDLTNLSGNKITKVLNPIKQDVTENFMQMLKQKTLNGGMNISYEDIMFFAEELNVTSGKITFTITYEVQDNIYPTRELTMKFTLNNEVSKIQTTLKAGESTTKSFEIFFNPSIIYEQVGESYVYINDKIVAYINENSANEEVRFTTSYEEHGDGDYYIRLVSSSGVILDSYKVTIKEPLNAGAIIVIIVVVAVVVTVVTTIIVLRRKMRIR